MEKFLKGPLLITFLVKKLKEKFPEKQISKAIIQRLMYLVSKEINKDYSYTLYHYGPHSSKIGEYINLAEVFNFIEIKWQDDKGYNINYLKDLEGEYLDKDEKDAIESIVNRFGNFDINELFILTTAIYMKDNFGIGKDEIVDALVFSKPQNTKELVEDILIKSLC